MTTRAVVLSAGKAQRIGGTCKALLEVEGRTMLDWQLAAGLNGCDEVVVVCRPEHAEPIADEGVTACATEKGGGPARALYEGISDGYDGRLIVVYADSWFRRLPHRHGNWAGCSVGRGHRHWDVIQRDGHVHYEPVEKVALVCVGVYHFADARQVRETVRWLGTRTSGELHMGRVLNEMGGVWFEAMPDWQDVGDLAAIADFRLPTETAA